MTSSKDDSNENHENIFEILDKIMFQVSRTKKMFMIMILTTLIIPPVGLLIMTSTFDSAFHDRFEERLQERLQSGELTEDEYQKIKQKTSDRPRQNIFLRPPEFVIFVISAVWLGIGISQWRVLSRWDKRYQRFKEKQKDTDKKFDDNSGKED